jgi:hypothetical protein
MEKLRDKDGSLIAVNLPTTGIMQIDDLANLIGKSTQGLKIFIRKNNLPHFKLMGIWFIDLSDFWKSVKSL